MAQPDRAWSELGPHRWAKILIPAGLLGWLFHAEIAAMVHLWWTDPNWSHGFLIPLFSLYFISRRRREILGLEYIRDPLPELLRGRRPQRLEPGQTRVNYLGLLLLLLILAFYVFNVVSPAGYAYLRPISLIAAAGAVVLFLGGWRLVRHTWLPILFFLFAIPLPRRYYVGLTMPMRQISATAATALLNVIPDVQATVGGVVIEVVYKGQRLDPALDVAEACSGMRLLMAFLALGVAMAYLHERPAWQRVVLLASTVPIAILCNIVRVTTTGFLYVFVGREYTQGIYHDALGLAMLPLAFGLYGLLAWFMAGLFIETGDRADGDVIVRKHAGCIPRTRSAQCADVTVEHGEPSCEATTADPASPSLDRRQWCVVRALQTPAFVICVAVLAVAAAGMSVATRKLGPYLQKEPLPLKKPLDALDVEKLSPYRVVDRLKIENEEIVESLGTEDYIEWVLEDPREPIRSPVRRLMLFITYYRLPDRVPHVPEECYTGGGYRRLSSDSIGFDVGDCHGERSIPGRYLRFERKDGNLSPAPKRFPVLYFFRVNGEYAGNRDEARMALNKNIFGKHSYFCKLELVFNQSLIAPTKDEAVAAGERLLTALLPVLQQDHWADRKGNTDGEKASE